MASLAADWSLSRVAEFRSAIGLSQAALAERVGISRPTLAKIEEGGGTKRSTIDFLVTRLQEEFDDQFASIRAAEVGENLFDLQFERKEAPKVERFRVVVDWARELDALSRKMMEVTGADNPADLARFHRELVMVLKSYEKLADLKILANSE